MDSGPCVVFLLDDEPDLVKALSRLLGAEGFTVRGFTSAQDFLAAYRPANRSCLVLDVAMPELDGLELHRRLTHAGIPLPIVFLTGHGDIPMSVQAIKAGAVDFLTKPVNDSDLLRAVRAAIRQSDEQREANDRLAQMRERQARLTHREIEVMRHVVAGQLNKQIAADLAIAEHTVKVHRARVMEKMGVQSLADLVRSAELLGMR